MTIFKWLKEEIEAILWFKKGFKKQPFKNTLRCVLIVVCICVVIDLGNYGKTSRKADKIYPELLSNVRELSLILEKEEKLENIDYAKYKFLFTAYDKGFTTQKKDLNKTLNDFYTNLRKIDVLKTKRDFDIIIGQGNNILAKFSDYFGCKDYFDYIEKQQDRPRAASESTVGVRFNFMRYIKYKFH